MKAAMLWRLSKQRNLRLVVPVPLRTSNPYLLQQRPRGLGLTYLLLPGVPVGPNQPERPARKSDGHPHMGAVLPKKILWTMLGVWTVWTVWTVWIVWSSFPGRM